MITLDKDAWMCDLAETYGIYDYRSLPLSMVATFSVGLRDNSRIKTKMRGDKVAIDTLLLGMLYDNISKVLVALGAIDKPELISAILIGENEEKDSSGIRTFTDAESFEKERKRIMEGIQNGRN